MKKFIATTIKEFLNEQTLLENVDYYTTSIPMKINDFIDIEVEERENYDIEDVNDWIKKYKIDTNDDLIWVALEPHIAARYQMGAEDWDNAKEIYEENPGRFDIETINSKRGFIIPETDDGDDGFIFVFKN
jgi:hypothetical protein